MFGKLLKYDLRAVFKYWWIAALSSVIFAVITGLCVNIINIDYTAYDSIYVIAIIGMVISIIGLCIFPVVTVVMILMRMQKHFFTDEGYLTFTLPVKKVQLLGSKLLTAFIFELLTMLLILIDIAMIFAIGLPKEFFDPRFWKGFAEFFSEGVKFLGAGYFSIYLIEIIALVLSSILLWNLMLFGCLIVGSLVARKHKLLAGIGIYYAVNAVFSGFMQFLMLDGNFVELLENISWFSMQDQKFCLAMIMLVVIGGIAAVGSLIHVFETYMLEHKLNLE